MLWHVRSVCLTSIWASAFRGLMIFTSLSHGHTWAYFLCSLLMAFFISVATTHTAVLYVLDQVFLLGCKNRCKPIAGVLIGDSPVKRKVSYSQPPKRHPQNGATIGTCLDISFAQSTFSSSNSPRNNSSLLATPLGHIRSYKTPASAQSLLQG